MRFLEKDSKLLLLLPKEHVWRKARTREKLLVLPLLLLSPLLLLLLLSGIVLVVVVRTNHHPCPKVHSSHSACILLLKQFIVSLVLFLIPLRRGSIPPFESGTSISLSLSLSHVDQPQTRQGFHPDPHSYPYPYPHSAGINPPESRLPLSSSIPPSRVDHPQLFERYIVSLHLSISLSVSRVDKPHFLKAG